MKGGTKEAEGRGRLMTAEQVAKELFHGTVDEQYVRRRVPKRIPFSRRMVRWWEQDVLDWIESMKGAS